MASAAGVSERFLRRTSISARLISGTSRRTRSRPPSGSGSANAGKMLMPIPSATIGNSVAGWPISCTTCASTPCCLSALSINGRLPDA